MRGRKGIGGHQSAVNQTDIWLTPRPIIQALGPFDLDPCACSEPRPWPTAATHYTKEDDGLAQPWFGRVWLNPPYGQRNIIEPWMRRLADHGNGIAIIFARTETEMFFDQVWNRADAVFFFKGRLTFCRRDGVPAAANGGAPSCLVAYGAANAECLRRTTLPGITIDLT